MRFQFVSGFVRCEREGWGALRSHGDPSYAQGVSAVVPAPRAHGPWPSQTVLDVLELEPDTDRTAESSASRAKQETSTWDARGPPSC